MTGGIDGGDTPAVDPVAADAEGADGSRDHTSADAADARPANDAGGGNRLGAGDQPDARSQSDADDQSDAGNQPDADDQSVTGDRSAGDARRATDDQSAGGPEVVDAGLRMRRWGRRLAFGAVATMVLVFFAWLAISALLAKRELAVVKADMVTLRSSITSGDVVAARTTALDLSARAHHAAQLTSGPVWSLTGHVPWVGGPFRSAQTLTQVADQLGRGVLPDLIEVSNQLDPDKLRTGTSGIDVSKVAAAAPLVHRSVLRLQAAAAQVNALPAKTWLSSVDDARASVATSMTSLQGDLAGLDKAASVLPAMLGQGGTKRYFVGIMNEAESRGLGGIPGAFAIVTIQNGAINFERYGSDTELHDVDSHVDLGAEYNKRYANADSTKFFLNSTISPNFPYVGQIWAGTWESYTGEHIDGAIAVDPTALSYLLKVSGPATAPDGTQITSENIVALTQATLYQKFSDQVARKAFLLQIASSVDAQLVASQSKAAGLVKAAFQGASERRLLIWSADPAVQKALLTTSFAGAISPSANPYVGLAVTNGAANKLDYYLDRSVVWERTGCGSTRQVKVTITLTNGAPASGLSYYVTGRFDDPAYPYDLGDNRLQAVYYGSSGGALNSVTIDGKPGAVIPATELGHPTYFLDLEIPHGATKTIVLNLTEPAGTGAPTLLEQPLVRPIEMKILDAKCS